MSFRLGMLRAAALVGLLWTCPLYAGSHYTFHSVADTSSGAFSDLDTPTINNAGDVAFRGVLHNGAIGIFTGPNPTTDGIVSISGDPDAFETFALNNNGAIAFPQSFPDGSSGIFLHAKFSTATIVDTTASFSQFGDFALNDAGKVAFVGVQKNGTVGVYTGPNPATDTVADTSGAFLADNGGAGPNGSPAGDFSRPRINNSGKVVFFATLKTGPFGDFTGPNPATDTIATSTGAFNAVGPAALDDAGHVAFVATSPSALQGMYSGPNPATDTIADNAGPYAFFGNQWLSDDGKIAFSAGDKIGPTMAIYSGVDPATNRVIGEGDPLFGVNLIAFNIGDQAINDHGVVVFGYELNDGRKGIAMATPGATAIPLPTAVPATMFLAGVFAARSTFHRLRASMRA